METNYKKGEAMDSEEFKKRAKDAHGNRFDYSKSIYKNSRTKVIIGCNVHGDFSQIPSDHLSGRGCAKCHFDSLKRWSSDDDNILVEFYQSNGAKWCATKLGKTYCAVRARAKSLKITKPQNEAHTVVPAFLWTSLTGRVKRDGYILDFDRDFIAELYVKQNGKCALTGWDINFGETNSSNNVSIDRIDSNGDYMKNNVQLTDKRVNRCKLNNTDKFFYEMSAAIHRNLSGKFSESEMEWELNQWADTEMPKRITKTYTYPPNI